ncbi:MAG: tetratricopeptide repeat protein [Gemmatimonadaceae bacterium]|nr:tetratricopeptide repeat protein [Gemmatimonadaceae bacterium]
MEPGREDGGVTSPAGARVGGAASRGASRAASRIASRIASRVAPLASDAVLGLLLIAAVFVAYAPALAGDLLWDDAAHITVGALQGWDGLARIWLDPGATQQYYPVLHSAFWVEHRLWGSSVLGYHLVTAALHALAACLVALLGQRLAIRGAWIAGFLFALHPVHVESVAWISEQKNTLSLVLALLSVLAWLRFDESRAPRHWILAFLLFALALGAKTVTATVPCALLVLVWWRRGAIAWRRDVLPLLPWLVLGIAAGLGTAWVERHVIGAIGTEFTLSPLQRLLLAGRAVWHYLATFLWPAHLVFTYPRWSIAPASVLAWAYPAAILALGAVLWRARHRTRAPLAAMLVFAGMLFPVLGFLDVYPFRYSFVADHFQYHANVALCMLAGSRLALLRERAEAGVARRIVSGAVCTMLLALATLTWREASHYRDAESLYRATIAGNPTSWMAHHNLGRLVSRKAGGLNEAIAHFQAAIALKPDHARAHYSLGVALQRVGRAAEAVPHFEAAIRFEPGNPELVANSHYIAGDILRRDPARLDEAIAHLREAVRRKPKVAQGHNTLGEALLSMGRVDDARGEFAEAVRLQPGYEAAQANLARVSGPASGRDR